jgi:hypothetical protein
MEECIYTADRRSNASFACANILSVTLAMPQSATSPPSLSPRHVKHQALALERRVKTLAAAAPFAQSNDLCCVLSYEVIRFHPLTIQ